MGSCIELDPVSSITAGCIGDPGHRTFYLQASKGSTLVTLLCEKLQVQQLALGIAEFVQELENKLSNLEPAVPEYSEIDMGLKEPIDPIFRVGEIGIGYDEDSDRLVLAAKELVDPDNDPHDVNTVRMYASRSQMLAMGAYSSAIAAQGRLICGNCLQPIDPQGHFCPKRNGHKN